MGLKPLIIIFLILTLGAAYLVGGSENISKKIQQYTEEKFKADPVEYEKYTFMNATYCNWTAKYDRSLELLDLYDQRFDKEENLEKSMFLRAQNLDGKLDGRAAKAAFEKYIAQFPEGKNIKKAKERYFDLKSYL